MARRFDLKRKQEVLAASCTLFSCCFLFDESCEESGKIGRENKSPHYKQEDLIKIAHGFLHSRSFSFSSADLQVLEVTRAELAEVKKWGEVPSAGCAARGPFFSEMVIV